MSHRNRIRAGCLALVAVAALWQPVAQAEDNYDLVARYVLETVRAFRSAYVMNVVEHVREGGIVPKEDWIKDAHAIPLPAQFVKAAAADLESFEVGLIGLTPVYKSNLPRTQAEMDALQRMTAERSRGVVSFADGKQFKAMAPDIAVVQSCVDCHNNHPDSPWRNFRKGDIMGAVIVRLNKQ